MMKSNKAYLLILSVIAIIFFLNLASASYWSPELNNQLMGYYKFDDKDNATGAKVVESTGQNPNGSIVGTLAVNQTGKKGTSFEFYSTGWVNATNSSLLDFHNYSNYSVMLWARTKGTGGNHAIVEHSSSSAYGWGFSASPGVSGVIGTALVNSWSGPYDRLINYAYYDNNTIDYGPSATWHLIGFTYNGSGYGRQKGLIIYIDGKRSNESFYDWNLTKDIIYPSMSLVFGSRDLGGEFAFTGSMDEAGLWNRTLTDAEVAQLYNNGLGLTYTNSFLKIPTWVNASYSDLQKYNLMNSLACYFDLNDTGATTNVQDTYKGLYNGTKAGAVKVNATGWVESSYKFDWTTSDYFSFSNPVSGPFSVSFWINYNNLTSDTAAPRLFSSNTYMDWQIEQNTNKIYIHKGNADNFELATRAINGTWMHMVVTYNGSQVRAYINGTLDANTPQASTIKGSDLASTIYWGRYHGSVFRLYGGLVDEISWWNRSLTAEEVTELYQTTSKVVLRNFDIPSGTIEINLTTPINETRTNNVLDYNATIFCSSGCKNATIYFINSTGTTVFSNFSTLDINPVPQVLRTVFNLSANMTGTGVWYINVTDSTNIILMSEQRTIIAHSEPPSLTWYKPAITGTFTNQTPYSLIVNISDPFLDAVNLTVYNSTTGTGFCYQEFANVTTACGGLDTGLYTSNLGNPSRGYDGDWSTSANDGFSTTPLTMIINYTKPASATGAIWEAKFGDSPSLTYYKNLTIPQDCLASSTLSLQINMYTLNDIFGPPPHNFYRNYSCLNSTGWNYIFNNITATPGSNPSNALYEEAIIWDMPRKGWYNNFTQNITVTAMQVLDSVPLSEGTNTIEVCARDSATGSPRIIGANFTKTNVEETEYQLPNGNIVTRSITIRDASKNKLSAAFVDLNTTENWIDDGKHYKTTWIFNETQVDFFEIELKDINGELELLTDRGRTRIVDLGRNYYWSFEDISQSGFDVEYTQNVNTTVEIKVTKGSYIPTGGKWIVDPIVGGLNSVCESKSLILDITTPIIAITYPEATNFYTRLLNEINWTITETNPNNCWIDYNGINSSVNCLDLSAGWSYLAGNDTIIIYANDSAGNIGKDIYSFTVTDDVAPNVTLVNPQNNSFINESFDVNLTAIVNDFFGVDNATLTVYNQTGLYNQTTFVLSGVVQSTVGVVISFLEGIYRWAYSATHLEGPITYPVEAGRFITLSGIDAGYTSLNNSLEYAFNFDQPDNITDTFTGKYNTTGFTGLVFSNETSKSGKSIFLGSEPAANYFLIPNITDVGTNFTWVFWIYHVPAEGDSIGQYLLMQDSRISNNLFLQASSGKWYVWWAIEETQTYQIQSNNTLSNGTWTMLTFTCRDGIADMYFNNTKVGTDNHGCSWYAPAAWKFASSANNDRNFGGNFDNFMFFKASFNQTTITDFYNNGIMWNQTYTPPSPPPTTYADNWTFAIDNTPPELTLISPQNNTGFKANNFTINVTAYDLTEQRISFRLFNMSNALLNESNFTDKRRTLNFGNLSEGDYQFSVDIIDGINYTNTTGKIYVYLDRTAPSITDLSPLNNTYTNISTVNFSANVTDALLTQYNILNTLWEDNNSQQSSSTVLGNNLVAFYNFDEASGQLIDRAYGRWNGSTTGTVALNDTGKINRAYHYTAGYTSIGDLDLNTSITISLWVNASAWAGFNGIIVKPNDAQTSYIYSIIKNDASKFQFRILTNTTTTGYTVQSTTSPSANVWYHIVGVFDDANDNLLMYVNGVNEANLTATGTLNMSNANLTFGRIWEGSPYYLTGILDEVGIWNRALNASEVSFLYNSGKGKSFKNFYYSTVTDSTLGHLQNVTWTLKNTTGIVQQRNMTIRTFQCYQETATTSTSCGGVASGSYACGGSWDLTDTCSNVFDGNWATFGRWDFPFGYLTVTYTKPANALPESFWTVKASNVGEVNYSIPTECWDYNGTDIKFYLYSSGSSPMMKLGCLNNTGGTYWYFSGGSGVNIYEEAMYWVMDDSNNNTRVKGSFVSTVYNFIQETVYTWFFTATDTLNNIFSTAERTITYDATYPLITVTYPQNNTGFNTTSFTVNVTAYDLTEQLISFRLYNFSLKLLNEYNYTNGTRSQLFSGLSETNYFFEVIIKDQLNQTNTTGLYTTYVDLSAPQGWVGNYSGSGTSPLNNTYTNVATNNFTVNASDKWRTITAWTSNNQDVNANYLTTGLKAYYKLDDTGESNLDSFKGRYNGTNETLKKGFPGIINYAYNFSAAGRVILGNGAPGGNIYSDEGETSGANYAVSLWIYPTYNTTYRWILGNDYTQIYMIDGKLHFPSPSEEPTSISTIPLYTWTHVTYVCNTLGGLTANKTIYINGALDFSGIYNDGCYYPGDRQFYLGGTTSGGQWYGKIDEVAFWNRTLNGSEVVKLYNGGSGITYGITETADSSVGHLSNLTFVMKNETDSIINQTNVNLPTQPKSTFLGVVYEFVTEGIYKWFYKITDAVGFTTNTTEAKITYDITLPVLNITFPQAINYTINPLTINYTYTEINPNLCWYSTDGGTTNISITCGNNVTGLSPNQGTNTYMIAMNDSAGNVNQTYVTFFLDSINPTINFTEPTDINDDYVPRRYILMNVPSFDVNLANITVYVYNSSSYLINATTTTVSPNYQNISVPYDGNFFINATAYDRYGNFNSTETREIFVDTTGLFIYLNTPANNTYTSNATTNLTVNLSDATFGVANTTLYIYNTTGPVNITTTTFPLGVLQTTFGIVVTVADNVYNWWYDAFDFASNYLSSPLNHTLIVDTTPPSYIYLIPNSDGNNSYINRSSINYNVTAYDLHLRNVTIRLYDSGLVLNQSTLNTTINSNASFSGIFSGLTNGDWNLQAEACDIVGNCLNSSINLIHLDIINPRINFTDPTLSRNSLVTAYDLTAIWGNFTAIDSYPNNASLTLTGPLGYSNTTYWSFNQTTQSFFFNFTHLIDGTYNLSARVYDIVNHTNQTETRTIYITGNAPINMSYEFPTPLVGGTSLTYIPINVSVNEPNIRNITINLYYANNSLLSSVNSSSYVQNFYHEFHVADGFVYFFNATAYDIYGHKTDLPTYQIQTEYGTGNTSICKLLPLPGTYTLIRDLNKSNGVCLEVGTSNVVIDCNGHSIIVGEGSPIYSNKNGVTIRNCILDNIGPALNITGGSVTATNCTFMDSTYGIWLNGGMVTVSNSIFDNNDYGIYLTGRAIANVINESGFINSSGYRLTNFNTAWNFRDVTINTVINTSNLSQTSIIDAGNYTYANGYITNASAANYNNVKISYTYAYDLPNTKAVFNNVRFIDNTYGIYHNYTAISPGGASGSVVWGPSGAGTYTNVTFTGTATGLVTLIKSSYNKFIDFTSSTGGVVSYTNSSYNLFDDSTLTGTTVTLAASSTDNTFHDTTYSSESVDTSSKLIRTWTTKIITKDTQGDKVGGVTVHINDGTNTTTGTAPSGEVSVDIIQYINNGTVVTHNPYEVFGVLVDYGNSLFTDTQTTSVTSADTQVTLTFAQQIRSTLLTRQVGFILMAILLLIGLAASTGFFIVKMRNGESVADIWKYFIIMMIWNTIFLVLFLVLGRYVMNFFYPA